MEDYRRVSATLWRFAEYALSRRPGDSEHRRDISAPPPLLEHELCRFHKPDGREALVVLRDVRGFVVELRQLLWHSGCAEAELLSSKCFLYGCLPEDLDDAISEWEAAGGTSVGPPAGPPPG